MKATSTKPLPDIAILAPGLLGASLAAACRKRGICDRIHVWARREETRLQCRDEAWCDACYSTAEEAVEEADLVWICAPVGSIAQLAGKIAGHLKPGAVVSDVGSTKEKLVRQCELAIGDKGFFIGSHPMAGSEKSGTANADPELYEGRPCFVTPSDSSNPDALERVMGFWKALGMHLHIVTPKEHDHIVANISHLPHLVATSLAAKVSEVGTVQWKNFVGSGFMDTTRVAAGSVPMWMDIIDHNRAEILPALKEMIDALEHLRVHLESGSIEVVKDILMAGKEFRESLDS